MTRCRRCNRVLKTEPWASLGIGKICSRKQAAMDSKNGDSSDVIIPYDGGDIFLERFGDMASGLRTNVQRIEVKHSPTGFNFGYGGSGPADTALNIMLMFCQDKELAHSIYQDFKFKFLGEQGNKLIIPRNVIIDFIQNKKADRISDGLFHDELTKYADKK